jgi:hypothetical protein
MPSVIYAHVTNKPIMLSVKMLSVVMLSVVAPQKVKLQAYGFDYKHMIIVNDDCMHLYHKCSLGA